MATIIDFTKTGGMHFAQNDLAIMQEAYREGLSAVARLCGNLVILYGMEDNGSSYSPGVVAINGEILPFAGGGKMPNLAIQEDKSGNTFRDGVVQEIYTLRRVITTSVGGYPLSSFTRLTEIKNLVSKTGDSMSGNLSIPNATAANHAVNKGQLNGGLSGKANLVDGKVPIGELPAMVMVRHKDRVKIPVSSDEYGANFEVRHDRNFPDSYTVIGNIFNAGFKPGYTSSSDPNEMSPHVIHILRSNSFYVNTKKLDVAFEFYFDYIIV